MKVLITGGAGFIGSHLSESLLKTGHEVTCLDNFTTGDIDLCKQLHANYSGLYKYYRGNVEDSNLLEALISNSDVIYHLAATVGVKNVISDPIDTIRNNILGTDRVLELCHLHTNKRVFVFSTSEVYGKGVQFPFKEDQDVVFGCTKKLRWSYAVSKFIDEFLARGYFVSKKLNVTVVRLFNTIGVRQKSHYGMVVPRFCEQALNGNELTIYGEGQQTRCFTDVRDVVKFLIKLIPVKNSYGEVINIGNVFEISIKDLAEKIVKLTGSKNSKLKFMTFEEAYGDDFEDMGRRIPDNSKILSLVQGESFQYTLDDTLEWIISDLKKNIKN